MSDEAAKAAKFDLDDPRQGHGIRHFILALSACWSVLTPAGVTAAMPKPVCHDSPGYLVITRERNGETGNDITVRAKPKATTKMACQFTAKPKDSVLGKGESQDSLAMHARFLALDEGT